MIEPAFGHWLAGFIDGEGCFEIYKNTAGWFCCRFTLNMRADDEPVLLEIRERTGVGRVQEKRLPHRGDGSNRQAQVRWVVISKPDCCRLVEILDAHPLRAKKARDYAIWREAVEAWMRIRRHAGPQDWDRLATLREEIRAVRRYGSGALPERVDVPDPQLDLAL